MGKKEEEAAWASVGKKPPKPSRHKKPKPKPKPPAESHILGPGFGRLRDSLKPKEPKKKKK